jgi:predicted CopG family antitoxin
VVAVGNPKFTSIYVRTPTYEKLKELKKRLGVKTYSDVIEVAIDSMSRLEQLRVASFLCVQRANARAVPLGWARIFQQNNIPAEIGFSFLKQDGTDLVVDQEKCKEVFEKLLGGGPK